MSFECVAKYCRCERWDRVTGLGAGSGTFLLAEPCDTTEALAMIRSFHEVGLKIRVLGGAYGMGLVVRPDGDVQYMTYRDPKPARSLEKIDGAGAALSKFCESGNDIDKYVVSAIGKTEPYLSPRLETQRASEIFLSGRTPEEVERVRAEIISTTKDDIVRFAGTLADISKTSSRCVVGGKKPLSECSLAVTEGVSSK